MKGNCRSGSESPAIPREEQGITAMKILKILLNNAESNAWKHPDKYCAVCDRRIWWWQTGIRLYSLGNNRAHIHCAADYLRDELEAKRGK